MTEPLVSRGAPSAPSAPLAPPAPSSWSERCVDYGLLALAFALPLSIAATEILLGVTVVAWLLTRPWTRPQAPGVRALGLATLVLIGTWLLASATATDPWASLIKARKIYSVVLIFLIADWLRNGRLARRFVSTTFVAGLLTCVVGFLQFASEHARGHWEHPLEGVFSNAMTSGNVLTTLTVVALAFVLFARGAERRGRLDRVALGTYFVALVMTFRRGSYLAWLAASLALVGLKRARWLLIVPLVAALALAVAPRSARERALSIAHPVDPTSAGRVSLWKSGVAAFQDRPWTGWGLEDATPVIERYKRPDARFPAGHFHNNWVQIAVTTGAIGLLAYLAWMALAGLVAWRAFRTTRSAYAAAGLAAWIAFQVHGMFDWSFGDAEVANQLFVWLGLALAAGGAATGEEGSALTPSVGSDILS